MTGMLPGNWHNWLRAAVLACALAAQIYLLRQDLKVYAYNHLDLQKLRVESGSELVLQTLAEKSAQPILYFTATTQHNYAVTLLFENARLSDDTRSLLAQLNLNPPLYAGKLVYVTDTANNSRSGPPCLLEFRIEYPPTNAKDHALWLTPPRPEDLKRPDSMRFVYLRSSSELLIRVSANSQDGGSGTGCRNSLAIGDWKQTIGKDLELSFIASAESPVKVELSPLTKDDRFQSGQDELKALVLESLQPRRISVRPYRLSKEIESRKSAGAPKLTLTSLQLGGDFLDVGLTGLIGLPLSQFLGNWKWLLLVGINLPLLFWAGKPLLRTKRISLSAADTQAAPLMEANSSGGARVFMSYSWEDKDRVMEIHDLLEASGAQPWIDREEIRGGAEWELSIKEQMRASERLLIFLSSTSVQKAGYAWAEIRMAVHLADQQPEGKEFIFPVKLDNCRLPDLLSRWNSLNLYEPDGKQKLLAALGLPLEKH
jgi:TIR domain